jgi:hypothetical protein
MENLLYKTLLPGKEQGFYFMGFLKMDIAESKKLSPFYWVITI